MKIDATGRCGGSFGNPMDGDVTKFASRTHVSANTTSYFTWRKLGGGINFQVFNIGREEKLAWMWGVWLLLRLRTKLKLYCRRNFALPTLLLGCYPVYLQRVVSVIRNLKL